MKARVFCLCQRREKNTGTPASKNDILRSLFFDIADTNKPQKDLEVSKYICTFVANIGQREITRGYFQITQPYLTITRPYSEKNQSSDNKRGEKRKNRCKSGDWEGNCGMMRTVDCNLSTV